MSTTIEKIEYESSVAFGTGNGGACVVVLNDNHNTFEGVAAALARVVPNITYELGMAFAVRIHKHGRAVVWNGELEVAELYWQQLHDSGLTMAPIEHG